MVPVLAPEPRSFCSPVPSFSTSLSSPLRSIRGLQEPGYLGFAYVRIKERSIFDVWGLVKQEPPVSSMTSGLFGVVGRLTQVAIGFAEPRSGERYVTKSQLKSHLNVILRMATRIQHSRHKQSCPMWRVWHMLYDVLPGLVPLQQPTPLANG